MDDYDYAEDDCDYENYDQTCDDDDKEDQVEEIAVKKAVIFAVLSDEEIQVRQDDDVCTVCSILFVSREVAILLLLRFNWNLNTVNEKWFAEEERIRIEIGLLSGDCVVPNLSMQKIGFCKICFEKFDVLEMCGAKCGHLFCNICWNSYISVAINDGFGCLSIRCPQPSCCVPIGEDMIKSVVSLEDQKKYRNYLIRSYVESNKNMKWCPAPDCDKAIELILSEGIYYDVKCKCSYSFCWNCLEETHRPIDCETVTKWNQKNENKENTKDWILANSKPCPQCNKPIEKNNGCMHMTCRAPCKYEFCWLCLGPWNQHNEGYYACNKYQEAKKEGKISEQERKRLAAKESIKRYTHFFDRWAANEASRKQSVSHLEALKNQKLEKISRVQELFIKDIEFILKAWEQIIECRRVMKWAYAYGYFIEEKGKLGFFEFTQGIAESVLERLHQCAEEEVMQYEIAKVPSQEFVILKEKLTRLTEITRKYFDDLVKVLENGLADVGMIIENIPEEEELYGWMCERCTLFNGFEMIQCQACFHPHL